jgi:hypothetical protein
MRGTVIDRKRTNQPQGYLSGEHHNITPVTHYCLGHNYTYYPFSWTDEATGQEYEKGYYDENGQYYADVVFRSDGKYKNVVWQCEYCDTITKLDWTEGGPLICPQCGGTMKILSMLDEYTQDPLYNQMSRQSGYVDYADRNNASGASGSQSAEESNGAGAHRIGAWIFSILLILIVVAVPFSSSRSSTTVEHGQYPIVVIETASPLNDPSLFGTVLYLRRTANASYAVTDPWRCEKVLAWDEEQEAYFDWETGLWLWYNTEVYPNLWQYWYEPISGQYGSYGWMEYDNGVWYIETEADLWSRVPGSFDTSQLWHMESNEVPAAEETPGDLAASHDVIYLYEREPGICWVSDEFCCTKSLYWDEAEQNYLEPESGLWLWYNTEVDPPLWQYWYEPISADFGDYGWMEYENGRWYIELDAEQWGELPEEYDASVLWHIAQPTDSNLELFGDTVLLDETGPGIYMLSTDEACDRVLTYCEENGYYQEPETGLWLTYKNAGTESHWEYWYWTISPDFEGFGGLENRDGEWYVQDSTGEWIPVPEEYDTSVLWEIASISG